ncbi:hypothetical protein SAMN05660226_04186 [Parapedobacter luteus]|uniref:Uncharacterized protein n=1 Tax=Parapedobacter luteus TaxID=623280 RepID=A0A1T5FU21_9SPHI|nr:hypothetical protein [Parapedobacter luteus]SKB99693.1 hypothetical protein SAMN05660226_04186 [Parapedobacter luteus]
MTANTIIKKLRRIGLLYFILFHFGFVLLIVIRDTIPALRHFFIVNNITNGKNLDPAVINPIYKFTKYKWLNNYALFSGTSAGYHFFAPKIARSTILECIQFDKENNEVSRIYYPQNLRTYEGVQRYAVALNNMHSAYRNIKDSTERSQCYEHAIELIGKKTIQSSTVKGVNINHVSFSYYVYPNVENFRKGVEPTMVGIVKVEL